MQNQQNQAFLGKLYMLKTIKQNMMQSLEKTNWNQWKVKNISKNLLMCIISASRQVGKVGGSPDKSGSPRQMIQVYYFGQSGKQLQSMKTYQWVTIIKS